MVALGNIRRPLHLPQQRLLLLMLENTARLDCTLAGAVSKPALKDTSRARLFRANGHNRLSQFGRELGRRCIPKHGRN